MMGVPPGRGARTHEIRAVLRPAELRADYVSRW